MACSRRAPSSSIPALFADGDGGLRLLARRRRPPGSTCSGRPTRPTRRACCRAARRAGAQLGVYADRAGLAGDSRRRRRGSIACVESAARSRRPSLPVIIPVTEFRDMFGMALTNMINGADPARPSWTRPPSSSSRSWTRARRPEPRPAVSAQPSPERRRAAHAGGPRAPGRHAAIPAGAGSYLLFALPALVVIFAVIVFPWLFTVYMSAARLEDRSASALRRPRQLLPAGRTTSASSRSIGHTFYFTLLAVMLPLVLGIAAAVDLPPRVPAARPVARASSRCR